MNEEGPEEQQAPARRAARPYSIAVGVIFLAVLIFAGVNTLNTDPIGLLFECRGMAQRRVPAFDDAGTGDHGKRQTAAYQLLTTVYQQLSTVYFLLSTDYCLLPTVYCLLSTVYCLLPTVYFLLSTAYCFCGKVSFRGSVLIRVL